MFRKGELLLWVAQVQIGAKQVGRQDLDSAVHLALMHLAKRREGRPGISRRSSKGNPRTST